MVSSHLHASVKELIAQECGDKGGMRSETETDSVAPDTGDGGMCCYTAALWSELAVTAL